MKSMYTNKIFLGKLILTAQFPEKFNALCDEYFDINYLEVEKLIEKSSNQERYCGVDISESALNTSWHDFYQMTTLLHCKQKTMVDLGASYGKGSLLSSLLGYNNIYSIEIVKERILHGKDIAFEKNLKTKLFIQGNACCLALEKFDTCFIYQPVGRFLNSLLNHIADSKKSHELWIIESHGDLVNRIQFDNRFSEERIEFKLTSQRHNDKLYSYQKHTQKKREELIFEDNFYSASNLEISSSNEIIGTYTWLSPIEDSYIDYMDDGPIINLNSRRFSLADTKDRIIGFSPNISKFQKYFLGIKEVTYKGKTQRIQKVISGPREGLELSVHGLVNRCIELDKLI